MPKHNVGRPSKLTPDVKDRFLKAIRAGSFLEVACQAAGLDARTVCEWRQRGEGRHPSRSSSDEYAQFAHEVNKALADSEMILISRWHEATKDDWRASMEMLARRFPDRWANTQRVKVEVEKQMEAELNLLFEAIANDPSIPPEAKRQFIQHASNLQGRAEVAGQN